MDIYRILIIVHVKNFLNPNPSAFHALLNARYKFDGHLCSSSNFFMTCFFFKLPFTWCFIFIFSHHLNIMYYMCFCYFYYNEKFLIPLYRDMPNGTKVACSMVTTIKNGIGHLDFKSSGSSTSCLLSSPWLSIFCMSKLP